jgi:hypothetical protein
MVVAAEMGRLGCAGSGRSTGSRLGREALSQVVELSGLHGEVGRLSDKQGE